MILPLLLATPVDAQITSRLYNQCNPTTEPFNWELPATLCEKNPNFTPDITVGSDIYSVTFASQLSIPYSQTWGNPAWQYQDITIHGRLVLDINVLFFNCKVKMQPGSEIATQGSSRMLSFFSEFFACGQTWKGVKVGATGGASISYSKFEDADAAFTLTDGAFSSFGFNRFNRNNIGIRNDNASSGFSGLVFHNFIGNTFDCDSPLNTSWSVAEDFGDISFTGMYFDRCVVSVGQVGGFMVPGFVNVFKRQQYGIYAVKSDVAVWHAVFENMIDGWQNGEIGGVGIFSVDGSLTVREGMLNGSVAEGTCFFKSCDFAGIHGIGANLNIRYADFNGIYEFAIASEENNYGETVFIRDNTITLENPDDNSYNFGIALIRSIASGTKPHNQIQDNIITVAGGDGQKYGIAVSGGDQAIDPMYIIGNTVTVNNTGPNIYPIRVAGSDGDNYFLRGNTINFMAGNGSNEGRFGIMIDNCKGMNGQITSNLVNTDTEITTNTASSCIDIRTSENWTYCYNTVNRGLRGFRFRGDCSPSFVKNNNILAHERGLLIENWGIASIGGIGTQLRHGNIWSTEPTDYSQYAAQCASGVLPFYSLFITEDNTLQKKPTNISPSTGWFFVESGDLNYCAGSSSMEPPTDAALTGLDSMLIADEPTSAESWEWKKRLLYKLMKHPELMPASSDAETFFNNHIATVPGELAQFDILIDEALELPQAAQVALDSLLEKRDSILAQILAIEAELEPDSIDAYQAAWEAKSLLFADLSVILSYTDQIEEQIKLGRQTPLEEADSFNENIDADSDTFEAYQQKLNTLRLKLAKGEEFSSADVSLLTYIAEKTLGTQDATEWLANFLLPYCASREESSERSASPLHNNPSAPLQGKLDFVILPNPAANMAQANFSQPFSGELILTDIRGQYIRIQAVPNETSTVALDTGQLPNGVYFVLAKHEGKSIQSVRKLFINK